MASKDRAIAAAFALNKASLPYSSAESAKYTADLTANLRKLADTNHQSLLAHLLDMAAQEARWLSIQ